MNRQQIAQRIQTALNDPEGVYWQPWDLEDMVQEGQEVLAEEMLALKRTITIPRRPGVSVYQLDGIHDGLMAPYRMWLPDLHRRLEAVTLTDLDIRHDQWLTIGGDPWWWAAIDWRSFVIWPAPAGGGWIEIECYVWPETLQNAFSEPEFLPAVHEALVYYGEHLGYLRQWDTVRAVDLLTTVFQRYGRGRSAQNIEQSMSRLWTRSTVRGAEETL